MWYLWGYITENMVVWYGVWKAVKWISKAAMVKIKVLMRKFIITKSIYKITFNKEIKFIISN